MTPETIGLAGWVLCMLLAAVLFAVIAVSSSREATHKETIHNLRGRLCSAIRESDRLQEKWGWAYRDIKRLKREAETQATNEIALRKEN